MRIYLFYSWKTPGSFRKKERENVKVLWREKVSGLKEQQEVSVAGTESEKSMGDEISQ